MVAGEHWGMEVGKRYRFSWVDWIDEYGDGGSESMLMENCGVVTEMRDFAITLTLDNGSTVYLSREYYPQLVGCEEVGDG